MGPAAMLNALFCDWPGADAGSGGCPCASWVLDDALQVHHTALPDTLGRGSWSVVAAALRLAAALDS